MRLARVAAVALAAVATGVIVGVLVLGRGSDDETSTPSRFDQTVSVRASLEPRVHLFGDPVTAHIELRLDERRVRPDNLVVDALFRPYEQIAPVRRERRDVGDTVLMRFSYPLQCLARACAPGGPRRQLRFPPIRVQYVLSDVRARGTTTAEWPPIDVASRLSSFDIQEANWRADLEPPDVSYRMSPGVLAAALGGAALLLALAAGLLGWRLLERRPEEAAEEVSVERRPPLERALEHIGVVSANGATPERRRALERLARELDRVEQPTLSARARRLAWAPGDPDWSEVERLTDDVRAATGADA
jgi:hypothetical protein